MANCTNCGFQLDPKLAAAACPRCGNEVGPLDLPMPAAGGSLPPPPGPGAPPAFDSDAQPDSTLFGLPAAKSDTESPTFSAPAVPTPAADEGFGGLDAPLPPPPPSGTPQRSTDPDSIGEFDFGGGAGGLQLDVGAPVGHDAGVDLPAPAAPRPPVAPRAPAPPPNFSLDKGGGSPGLGELDLPAPAAPRTPGIPAPPLSGLDLPTPAPRRATPGPKAPPPPPAHGGALDLDLPAPAHLDLPAPAGARPTAPAGLDLPLGDDFDLPQPADASGLAPIGLDLPGAPDVDLPSPRGMDVQPANNLVTPAGLDLEPAGVGVAPADMGLAPHDLGMLAPKGEAGSAPLGPDGTPLEARPGFAAPRGGPSPREISSTSGSRKVVYAAAALGLVGALVAGLYVAGVFDGEPATPVARGLKPKTDGKGEPDKGTAPAAAERAPEVLALLDADTPESYAKAAKAATEANAPLGHAEAALLLHLRYGPDNKGANEGAAAIAPFAKSTEPHIKRVLALGAIARGQYDQAHGLLEGDDARTRVYRAMLRLAQKRPGDAISEAKGATQTAPDSAFAKAVLLQAEIDKDPDSAYETAGAAAKSLPGHPAVSEALARAAMGAGALKAADAAAAQLPTTGGAPAAYQARIAVLRGEIAAAQGDTATALAQFDTALELGGESITVLEGRVRAAIAAKDFTQAQTSMKALAKLAPTSVDIALLNIEMQVAAGDGDAALEAIDTLAKVEPKRIEVPYWRGEVQAMRLQVDEAQAEFAKVLDQDPTYHRVALAQAAMLNGARKPVEATAALDAGVARLREASGSQAAVAELLTAKARLLLAQAQRKAALTALDQALEAHPTNNAARVLRGTTRVAEGDAAGGKADLLDVYERAGGYPGLVAPLGKLFIQNGQLDELEELVGGRAADPNASNAVKLVAAQLRLAQGKPEEAKLLADEVLARSSNAWEAQLVMAQAFLDAGDPAAALKRIETVRPPEPKAELFLLKGKILEYNAKHTEARSEYARALAVAPDTLEARFLLGRLLAYSGQAKQALAELGQVTAATDAFPRAYLNIGRAQRDLGKNDDALSSFAKTLELDATLLEAHYLTGRVYLERGKAAKAIGSFQAATADAAKTEPWYAEAWLFLGRAQEKAGKRGAAKTSYQRFLKEAPAEHASRPAVERTIAGL